MTDPFAAAKAAQQDAQRTTEVPTGPRNADASPFATAEDFGGAFNPSPKFEHLLGRLCVLMPVKTVWVEDLNNKGQKKEIWSADLYVLSGGPFSFKYDSLVKEAGKPDRKEPAVFQVTNACTPEDPYVLPKWYVFAGYVNYKLTKLVDDLKIKPATAPKLFLGTVARVPSPQSAPGSTIESIAQEYAKWEADPRGYGKEPKSAWDLIVPTAEQREIANRWAGLNRTLFA